mgnify:CR=1 FL=1
MIYGVKSVSEQSEETMLRLAKDFEQRFPKITKLLRKGRYVEDMGESMKKKEDEVSETFVMEHNDDKEKILVVGYDDGTVVTFKDDVKILSQKYMTLTTDQFVHL